MTTFDVAFELEGNEVAIYRDLLSLWLEVAPERDKSMISTLIGRTNDVYGNSVGEIHERICFGRIGLLWKIVDSELSRLAVADTSWEDLDMLQRISIKLMHLEMSSIYK